MVSTDPHQRRHRDQILELTVLALLYVLQVVNAESLRHAITVSASAVWGGKPSLLSLFVSTVTRTIHPLAMLVFGVWLLVMVVWIVRHRPLPRWSFDGLGCWFCLRLVVEFLIINVLIFEPTLVAPGVLLSQIVLYLPFFVVCWGWFFHRLDWVGRGQPGQILQLTDLSPTHELGRFDYFHSAINTLLNKSKPTIAGVSRRGRIAVLIFNGMVLGLYTVAFTRILQLTKVVL
ncbi:MAG: hypothetical protein RLZZ137_1767 [Cyanobacteriota bacterium]